MSIFLKQSLACFFLVFTCYGAYAATDDWSICRQVLTEIEDSTKINDMQQLKKASIKLKQACQNIRSPQSLHEEASYQFAYAELMLGNLESSFQVSNDCIEKFYFSPRCHMLISSYFFMKKDWSSYKVSIDKGANVANVVAKRLKDDLSSLKKITPQSSDLNMKIAEERLDLEHANSVVSFYNKLKNKQ